MDVGKYVFTSFGDHAGPRSCLSDILWQASIAASEHIKGDPDIRGASVSVLSLYSKNLLFDCGKLLELLVIGGDMESIKNQNLLLNFLKMLGYISKKDRHYKIKIPIFLPDDEKIISEVNRRIAKTVYNFLE